jgi:SAM-dependent methyltransferase
MSVFKKYSQYYDLLYKDKDYQGEADYIDQLIKEYAPNSKTILDLGSGTGIHDYLLAQKGYQVKGVDFSEEMIAEATIKLGNIYKDWEDCLSFEVGDIRSWKSDKQFDVVISLFHVMSYQITNQDIEQALSTMKYHLKKGGIVIFDFWYGPGVLTQLPETRIKKFEDDKIQVTRFAEPKIFPNENTVNVNYTIFIKNKVQGTFEEITETHRMRYLFLPEMQHFLNLAEFSIVSKEEWMKGETLMLNYWNGCIIAQKL